MQPLILGSKSCGNKTSTWGGPLSFLHLFFSQHTFDILALMQQFTYSVLKPMSVQWTKCESARLDLGAHWTTSGCQNYTGVSTPASFIAWVLLWDFIKLHESVEQCSRDVCLACILKLVSFCRYTLQDMAQVHLVLYIFAQSLCNALRAKMLCLP